MGRDFEYLSRPQGPTPQALVLRFPADKHTIPKYHITVKELLVG
jgi:hypothetical protein